MTHELEAVNEEAKGIDAACGNPDHPNGAWHKADPIPASWQLVERLKQWANRFVWGCGCDRNAPRI